MENQKLKVDDEIELEQISMNFAEIIFATIDSQRPYLREWLPFVDNTTDLYDTVRFIESVNNVSEELRENVFVILFQNKFAGIIGFKLTDKANSKTEIGYWLSEHFQGKGIMTRSCRFLLRFAFEKMEMNRIQIKVAVGNKKSKKIPQNLGFSFEGLEREGELLSGGFTDLEVYSLLKREFIYP